MSFMYIHAQVYTDMDANSHFADLLPLSDA